MGYCRLRRRLSFSSKIALIISAQIIYILFISGSIFDSIFFNSSLILVLLLGGVLWTWIDLATSSYLQRRNYWIGYALVSMIIFFISFEAIRYDLRRSSLDQALSSYQKLGFISKLLDLPIQEKIRAFLQFEGSDIDLKDRLAFVSNLSKYHLRNYAAKVYIKNLTYLRTHFPQELDQELLEIFANDNITMIIHLNRHLVSNSLDLLNVRPP